MTTRRNCFIVVVAMVGLSAQVRQPAPFDVSGRMVHSGGTRIPGVEVRAVSQGVLLADSRSDTNGSYQLNVPSGPQTSAIIVPSLIPRNFRPSVFQYLREPGNRVTTVMLRRGEVSNEEAGEIEGAARRYIDRAKGFPRAR